MRTLMVWAAVAALFACARGAASPEAAPIPGTAGAPRVSADLITEAEIAKSTYRNAMEVVQGLRPAMLRERASTIGRSQPPPPPPTSGGIPAPSATSQDTPVTGIVVYLDDQKLGGVSTLQTIPALAISSIRYFNGRDAQTRWGVGHSGGVIQVVSRKR